MNHIKNVMSKIVTVTLKIALPCKFSLSSVSFNVVGDSLIILYFTVLSLVELTLPAPYLRFFLFSRFIQTFLTLTCCGQGFTQSPICWRHWHLTKESIIFPGNVRIACFSFGIQTVNSRMSFKIKLTISLFNMYVLYVLFDFLLSCPAVLYGAFLYFWIWTPARWKILSL